MRPSWLITPLTVALTGATVLAGCGGDGSGAVGAAATTPAAPAVATAATTASSAAPVVATATSPSATSPTSPADPFHGKSAAAPEVQARAIVTGSYPIAEWRGSLAAQWKSTPAEHWSARRITDVRWVARLAFTAPNHRMVGSWTIDAPLGPHPTLAQIHAVLAHDVVPAPRDAGARALSKTPPVEAPAQAGPIELSGVVVMWVQPSTGELLVDVSDLARGYAGRDRTGKVTSPAVARGLLLGGLSRNAPVKVSTDAATTITVLQGGRPSPGSLATFAAATSGRPAVVNLTWNLRGKQPRTLSQLVASSVSTIEMADGRQP